jgi:LPS sulfotransferase NodH
MRTGSNLLRTALQSSPQVAMANEIFSPNERVMGKDFDIIMANLLRHYPISVKAVGCKIFYPHLTAHEWLQFNALPDFKIIHLMRRNQVKLFLSLQIAQKTNRWIENKPGIKPPLEQRQIRIDPRQLKAFIQLSHLWREQARQRFKDRAILEIYYEDLIADFDRVVTEAITFIGAKQWDRAKVNLRKQNPEAMRDLILNYDELKSVFAKTPWRAYFDEA